MPSPRVLFLANGFVVFTSVRYDRKMGLSAPSSRGLLPTNLTLFSCLLKLPISLSMDLLLTAGEHVLRRDVANSTVQADIVVMFHVALPPGASHPPANQNTAPA